MRSQVRLCRRSVMNELAVKANPVVVARDASQRAEAVSGDRRQNSAYKPSAAGEFSDGLQNKVLQHE